MNRAPLTLSLLLAAAPAFAVDTHLAFQIAQLSNGLTVIVHEDHSVPVVAVNLWYKVGSNDEQPGKTGFAHLFEHYMFMGSEHSPYGQLDAHTGGCGGFNNATTNNDRTDYYEVIPSECLEEVLRLEADRMGFLDSTINQGSLDKQRAVVKNEKRVDENKPYGRLWETVEDTVFPQGNPNKHDTIGSMTDLDAASVADVRKFHATYYLPNNAILVLAGDVDVADVMTKVHKWFDAIPAGPTPPALTVPPMPVPAGRKTRTVTDGLASVPMAVVAYPIPGQGQPGWLELNAVANVLSGSRSSRLVQALQYDQRLVAQVSAEVAGLHTGDVLMITAMPLPGVSVPAVTQAIETEVAKVAREGVKARELSRVKAGLRTAQLDALQDAQNVAATMAEDEKLFGNPDETADLLRKIQDMKPADATKAAARYLTPDNASIVVISPKNGGSQ